MQISNLFLLTGKTTEKSTKTLAAKFPHNKRTNNLQFTRITYFERINIPESHALRQKFQKGIFKYPG